MKVLHVVDRETGGVPVAVGSYIRNTPEFDHVLLSPSGTADAFRLGDDEAQHLAFGAPNGPIARARAVRAAVRLTRPDVVHAHSSFSGAYVRLAVSSRRETIAYSPHCFAFERTDVSRVHRRLFRVAERLLAANTNVIAACGPGEKQIAVELAPRRVRVVEVPNVSSLEVVERVEEPESPGGRLRVGMIGRIGAQKDPVWFAETFQRLRELLPCASAVWLGEGDDVLESRLKAAGVRVSGWLGPSLLQREVDSLDLYLHSAAWEGFPIAVLDSIARARPVIVRDIGAFRGLPKSVVGQSALSDLVAAVNSGAYSSWADQNIQTWREAMRSCSSEGQREALKRVWKVHRADKEAGS